MIRGFIKVVEFHSCDCDVFYKSVLNGFCAVIMAWQNLPENVMVCVMYVERSGGLDTELCNSGNMRW